MIIATDISEIQEYSLREDSADNKTIFQLGVIPSNVRAYIDDTHSIYKKETEEIDNSGLNDKFYQFAKFGLKGWTNFKDKNGKDVEFMTIEQTLPRIGKRIVVSEECLSKLTLDWIVELGVQIIIGNKLMEEEKKS